MLPQLLTFFLTIIKYQNDVIRMLLTLLVGKGMFQTPDEKPVSMPYRKLQVDDLPLIEKPEKLDYLQLLAEHLRTTGKPLKPVKRHQGSTLVPATTCCPRCQAPSDFLYANNGDQGQFLCKVCDCLFSAKNRYLRDAVLKCPHCAKTLERIKERKDFDIFKCKQDHCPFYLGKLRSMSVKDKQRFAEDPQAFKVRYIYRQFRFQYQPLSKHAPQKQTVDLSRIQASPHTLGLILTYHVNYGISARKTAALMEDVHGVHISYQTVLNYERSAALWLKPFVEHFPYQLSNQFCGDETYIRVGGRWHYLFFFFDTVKKIILSCPVSEQRNTLAAIRAIDQMLVKLPDIPDDLTLVVDGNPIYLLAQHFFAQHHIHFDVKQVIGLTNEDPVSKKFRPFKQVIERLNRTFKGNYRSTNGFGSTGGSKTYITLFVAYFNFLREHSALERRVPVVIPELESLPNMPARWARLIQMAQDWNRSQAS